MKAQGLGVHRPPTERFTVHDLGVEAGEIAYTALDGALITVTTEAICIHSVHSEDQRAGTLALTTQGAADFAAPTH